jgi:hypothetical protein
LKHTNTTHADKHNNAEKHNADRQIKADKHNGVDKHSADRQSAIKRNADKNAERAHRDSIKHDNKIRHNENKARRNDYRSAHSAYRNGRFNDRYYGSHFGRYHPVVFGGGMWVGRPFWSPFWWGGIEWGFGPGIFWPDAWGMGIGCYIEYIPGIGYVLVNPAFPDTTLALTANLDAEPVYEPDAQ